MKIAVLTGGMSLERDVSFGSGKAVAEAMQELGHDYVVLDIAQDVAAELIRFKPDVAFMALAGGHGENGSIQGMREVMGIPYTHSGVRATADAMDKDICKKILRSDGLPVPDGMLVAKKDFNGHHLMAAPYIVKPNDDGSSLGGFFFIDFKLVTRLFFFHIPVYIDNAGGLFKNLHYFCRNLFLPIIIGAVDFRHQCG